MEVSITLDIDNPAGGITNPIKIPLDYNNFVKLYNGSGSMELFVDGDTETKPPVDWSIFVNPSIMTYEFKGMKNVVINRCRFYDITGSLSNPILVYAVDEYWQRVLIASFDAGDYMEWKEFTFPPVKASYIYFIGDTEIGTLGERSSEFEIYGEYEDDPVDYGQKLRSTFKDLTGVCMYEWNVLPSNDPTNVDQSMLDMVSKCGWVRHYLDWRRTEETEGGYTFQPERRGGWFLDSMYSALRDAGTNILTGFQKTPYWMYSDYPYNYGLDPNDMREDVTPVIYGKKLDDPKSYLEFGKMAFQFAARYGSNTDVPPQLVTVDTSQPNPWDPINEVKIGLGLVSIFECGNEVNKTWVNREFYLTAREHAANLSCVYDGHKGTLGNNVGVKTADPDMLVATMGTIEVSPSYFQGIIDWSKQYRGYLPNGEVDVPFDCINFHSYRNDAGGSQHGSATTGVSPEQSNLYNDIVRICNMVSEYFPNKKVIWGELGYDWNQQSIQKAPPIGTKTTFEVAGDWLLRSLLIAGRAGIDVVTIYQLYDDDSTGQNPTQYATSGIAELDLENRHTIAYIRQCRSFMDDFVFDEHINDSPNVDRWVNGTELVYAIWSPTQDGTTGVYTLNVSESHSSAVRYNMNGTSDTPTSTGLTVAPSYNIAYDETPVFVKITI